MSNLNLELRVVVTCDDPVEESKVAELIGAELIRLGIKSVSVIANAEHLVYVDSEVHNVTTQMHQIFNSDPRSIVGAFIVGNKSK